MQIFYFLYNRYTVTDNVDERPQENRGGKLHEHLFSLTRQLRRLAHKSHGCRWIRVLYEFYNFQNLRCRRSNLKNGKHQLT